jgi:hypothetical protein
MDIDIKYIKKENYLYLTLSGKLIFDRTILEDQTLPQAIKEYNCLKIIIDIRELDIFIGSFLDKYAIGEYFGYLTQPPQKIKTAILAKDDFIDDFISLVAKNRGAFFEAFSDKEKAVNWLLTS